MAASRSADLQSSECIRLFLCAVNVLCKHRPLGLLIQLSDTYLIHLEGRGEGM